MQIDFNGNDGIKRHTNETMDMCACACVVVCATAGVIMSTCILNRISQQPHNSFLPSSTSSAPSHVRGASEETTHTCMI